jgi:ATP-dependent DNA ligase
MRRLTELYDRLDATTSTNAKVRAIADYLRAGDAADVAWGLFVLTGRRLKRFVSPASLRAWAAEAAGVPAWLADESHTAVGDSAEAAALLFDLAPAAPAAAPPADDLPLHRWMTERLLPLYQDDDEARRAKVLGFWRELDGRQRYVLNKLMTGSLRVGVSRTLVARAAAEVAGAPQAVIEHRLTGPWEPTAAFVASLLAAAGVDADPAKAYPFFLASPLEGPPAALGDRREWQAEWKWDGIRAQLLRRGGQANLWSRGEELITERFPEVVRAAGAIAEGSVLDGELLAYRDGAPLPFALLQRRIGRLKLGPAVLREAPVIFLAYDLLEAGGVDLRAAPLSERRARLERIIAAAAPPGGGGPLLVSPTLAEGDWEGLERAREGSRERGVEGLMLKRLASPYGVGRRRGDWWKWKIDPLHVDAVLVYAQAGTGRRANLFTDYTFAVWKGAELVPVAKAYSGLDDAEIAKLDRWIRAHTKERHGPVRAVEPEHVFELAFEGVQASPRHKSGVAFRFPRIARWRTDKRPADADTLETVHALLRAAPAKAAAPLARRPLARRHRVLRLDAERAAELLAADPQRPAQELPRPRAVRRRGDERAGGRRVAERGGVQPRVGEVLDHGVGDALARRVAPSVAAVLRHHDDLAGGRERLEQRVVEGDRGGAVVGPERLAHRLHPRRVEARVGRRGDRLDDVPRELVAEVRALAADRVHRDRGVAERHHDAARGQPADGRAHGRRHAAHQEPVGVGDLGVAHPRRVPRHQVGDHLLAARDDGLAGLAVVEAVHRAARLRLEEQAPARALVAVEVGYPERLADGPEQVELDRAERDALDAQRRAGHDRHRELALRPRVHAARRVPRKELGERPPPRGDDHELVLRRDRVEAGHVDRLDDDAPPGGIEVVHPAVALQPQVDRLRERGEAAREREQAVAERGAERQVNAPHLRRLGLPVREAELALEGEGELEPGGGAGGARAVQPAVGGAVRIQRDLVPGAREAVRGEQAGLARADDGDPAGGHRTARYRDLATSCRISRRPSSAPALGPVGPARRAKFGRSASRRNSPSRPKHLELWPDTNGSLDPADPNVSAPTRPACFEQTSGDDRPTNATRTPANPRAPWAVAIA